MTIRQNYMPAVPSYVCRVENNAELNKRQIVPPASAILKDGSIVEMMSQPQKRRTFLAVQDSGTLQGSDGVDAPSDGIDVPRWRSLATEEEAPLSKVSAMLDLAKSDAL
jgi:hypothetical protein